MMDVLGVTRERGAKAQGRYPIGFLRDGTPVTLPVRIVRGAHDGPTVSMTGCVHGDE